MKRDATLEEMWKIKEELSTAHNSWEEYIADMFAYQEEERKRGVKFVSFSSGSSDSRDEALGVAEDSPSYGAKEPTPSV